MAKTQMTLTGIDTTNHSPQDGVGCKLPNAKIFCGDAIGDAIPPTLEANVIPQIKAFEYPQDEGNNLRIG